MVYIFKRILIQTMDNNIIEYLDLLLEDYLKDESKSESLIIDVSLIKKKIHHDFLEDLIQYLNCKGFNAYYCSEEKKIFAFTILD